MIEMDAHSPIDLITTTQVRQLLKAWENPAKLGQHRLARLTFVEQHIMALGQSESELRRGLILKESLNAGIQTLRPHDGEPHPHEKGWRTYLVITERYCFGRLPEWIMVSLSISSRSFYRALQEGVTTLALYLTHLETEALTNHSESSPPHPTSSTLLPLLPPNRPDHPLVERDTLLSQLKQRCSDDNCRKIALHGLPGVGKTTAALTFAQSAWVEAMFPDGVLWLGLGRTPDLVEIQSRLAEEAGVSSALIKNSTNDQLAEAIRAQLSDKRILLVLDDVWHQPAAQALSLQGRQGMVLITTRQPSVAVGFAGAKGALPLSEFDASEAQSLLIRLAPELGSLGPTQLERLYALTGGLPLTLTIFGRYLGRQGYHGQQQRLVEAVSRLAEPETRRSLTIESDRFGPRNMPKVSLQRVIELSCESFSAEEMGAFIALTILPPKPNSFGLEMALALIDGPSAIFYLLVDCGLVESLGGDRYTLHQSVHDVALPPQPDLTVVTRCIWQMVLTAERVKHNHQILSREQTNIEAALKLCEEYREFEAASRILIPYGRFLLDRGQYETVKRWVRLFSKSRNRDTGPQLSFEQLGITARLEHLMGRIAEREGRPEEALNHLKIAWEQGEDGGISDIVLSSQIVAIQIYLRRGEPKMGVALAEEIRSRINEVDDPVWQGQAHLSLSGLYYFIEAFDKSFEHIMQAKQRFEVTGRPMGPIYQNMGVIALERGEYSTAETYYEKSLAAYEAIGNRVRIGQLLNNIGLLAQKKGRWRKAADLYQQALALRKEIEDRDGQGQSLLNLSQVALAQKDVKRAKRYIAAGLEEAQAAGVRFREGRFLSNLAQLCQLQGEYPRALQEAEKGYAIALELDLERSRGSEALQQGIIHLRLGDYEAAEYWLKLSRTAWQEEKGGHHWAEVNLYLAELSSHQNRLDDVRRYLEEGMIYFDRSLDGILDPVLSLQIVVQLLDRLEDEERAARYREKGVALLKQQSLEIGDPMVRQGYLDSYRLL